MKDKFECDYRGCKEKCEELTMFAKAYPYTQTKTILKYEDKWLCPTHAKEIQSELNEELKNLPKSTTKQEEETKEEPNSEEVES